MLISDAPNHAIAPPEIPASFSMNVLFSPNPFVALVSAHKPPPYSSASLFTNIALLSSMPVELSSIAPPFLVAWLFSKRTLEILALLEALFKEIAPP